MSSDRSNSFNPWLNRFAFVTALATLGLIGIGGLVTSKEAGMSVPDWPTAECFMNTHTGSGQLLSAHSSLP
jgi:heme A synthase